MPTSKQMNIGLVIADLGIKGGTQKVFLRLIQYLDRSKIQFTIYTFIFDRGKCYPELLKFQDRILCLGDKIKVSKTRGKSKLVLLKPIVGIMNIMMRLNRAYHLYKYISPEHTIINFHDQLLGIHWVALFYKFKIGRVKPKLVWQLNDFPSVFHVGPSTIEKNFLYYLKYFCNLPVLLFEKIVGRIIDEITVNVSKNKSLVKTIYRKKAHTFYPGIDRTFSKIKDFEDFHSPIRLVTTSVLFPYRRIEDIIHAMYILRQKNVDCILSVIGSYNYGEVDYYTYLKDLIGKYSLGERVKFLGQIELDKIEDIYFNSDVFLFVNHNQSWGLAVFEAMGIGLPAIVSSTVGATEILEDGKNAVVVKPKNPEAIADVITKLRNDWEYRNNLVKNAFALVNKYDWDSAYSSHMLNLFRTLMKAGDFK